MDISFVRGESMVKKIYAQIINKETHLVDIGDGDNETFYKSIGMKKMDVELAWDGNWYEAGYAPQKPHNQTILEQIEQLESTITDRNFRSALLGDEFAINKINDIEAQIAELRKQLEGDAQ